MQTGKIKFFNESKGYGFITDDASKKDVFVHASGLLHPKVNMNDAVSFELSQGKRGELAINVQLIQ
jgi:CspA family cold shock protein